MILFLFLLLVVVAFGILAMRRQSYFQHREMMRSINPERIAREDAEDRRKADKTAKGLLIVAGLIGLLLLFGAFGAYCQQFKGFGHDIKIESSTP